jgi:rhamnogalacturonyl hydrolase YesR
MLHRTPKFHWIDFQLERVCFTCKPPSTYITVSSIPVIKCNFRYEENQNATLKATLDTLRVSLNLQPQNVFGGYWYFVYPQWSYLDGMYSVVPFLSYYTTALAADNSSAVANDIMKQLDLLWTHCRQNSTGLLVHGYDASKKAIWANPINGASSYVWSRSVGWYLMALVDTLELEIPNFPLKLRTYLQRRLIQLSEAIISVADAQTGCWWQVMTFPGRPGNYIESSGSAMFTYGLYKAARLGYLPKRLTTKATDTASKCYRNIVDAFVVQNSNGTLGYNGTVAVCSLNSTASYEVGHFGFSICLAIADCDPSTILHSPYCTTAFMVLHRSFSRVWSTKGQVKAVTRHLGGCERHFDFGMHLMDRAIVDLCNLSGPESDFQQYPSFGNLENDVSIGVSRRQGRRYPGQNMPATLSMDRVSKRSRKISIAYSLPISASRTSGTVRMKEASICDPFGPLLLQDQEYICLPILIRSGIRSGIPMLADPPQATT